jgi:hypothetical protein
MNDLCDRIRQSIAGPVGTWVHIGAGGGAVAALSAASPSRMVLVEGDEESLTALRVEAAAEPRAEVHGIVLAASAGELAWHRHSLPALNGPIDRRDMTSRYPRLAWLGSRPVRATAMAEWLAAIVETLPAGEDHVLALDVPGQEDALLNAVPAELLQRFATVGLRVSSGAADVAARTTQGARDRLLTLGFRPVDGSGSADALWPVHVLRLDREAAERQRLQQTLALAEAAHKEQLRLVQSQLADATSTAREAQARLAELEQARQAARVECDGLARVRDEEARRGAECAERAQKLQSENERLAAEVTRLKQALAETENRLQAADTAREAIERKAAELDARQRLIDAELLKAEAQLELVKDVLIREKNF